MRNLTAQAAQLIGNLRSHSSSRPDSTTKAELMLATRLVTDAPSLPPVQAKKRCRWRAINDES
jgi:hypothetical protein